MKKVLLCAVIALFLFWPQRQSDAKEPVVVSILNYQLSKNAALIYQIDKKIQKIEYRIDSIKKKK